MSAAPRGRALLVAWNQPALDHVLLLARHLQGEGGLTPLVLVAHDELAQAARAAGVAKPDLAVWEDWLPPPPEPGPWRRLGLGLGRRLGRGFAAQTRGLTRHLRRGQAAAMALLDQERPLVVVGEDDRRLGVVPIFWAAHRRGLPIVVNPYAYPTTRETLVQERRGHPEKYLTGGRLRRRGERLARRHPRAFLLSDEALVGYYSLPEVEALHRLGMLPRDPLTLGGGLADLVAVAGPTERDQLLAAGVAPERLVITGDPSLDHVAAAYRERPQRRARLLAELGLDPERPLAINALPQFYEHGRLDWPEQEGLIRAMAGQLSAGGCSVAHSLHPKAAPERYRFLAREFGQPLLAAPLREVLACADLFVAGYSSTIKWAAALGLPTLVVHYLEDTPIMTDYPSVTWVPSLDRLGQAMAQACRAPLDPGSLTDPSRDSAVAALGDLVRHMAALGPKPPGVANA